MSKRKALELKHAKLKKQADEINKELKYVSLELEQENQAHFTLELIKDLKEKGQYIEYIEMIRSFDISYKHRFTISLSSKITVGKQRDQRIYIETNHNTYLVGQEDAPQFVLVMMPFVVWLYSTDINVERRVRDYFKR